MAIVLSRRELLNSIAVASAGLIAGCCHQARPILNNVNVSQETLSYPLLAPKSVNETLRVTRSAIDPHVHIFNASDIQAGGYLAGPVAQDVPSSLRFLVRGLAKLVDGIARNLAISTSHEWRMLDELRTTFDKEGVGSTDTWLQRELIRREADIVEALNSDIRGTLRDQINDRLSQESYREPGRPTKFGIEYLQTVTSGEVEVLENRGRAFRDPMDGIFAFIMHMLLPRSLNLKKYQAAYTESSQSIGIEKCMASMVDFDRWVGSCNNSYSPLADQILLMERISVESAGYLRPIVSYNPWTDIEENDHAVDLVEEALRYRGFVGVKIYPPIGYFPSENYQNPEYPKSLARPDLRLVDEKLGRLFEICREIGRPVMAHANRSRGRDQAHNILGGPEAWARFFDSKQNFGTRINLGHMGGETAKDQLSWTLKFVDIMKSDSAKFLYGDLGYWEGLAAGEKTALDRLLKILDIDVSNSEKAIDRVMFGTDWFMTSKERDWNNYAVNMQQVLSKYIDEDSLEKIFSSNASRLFRI